MRGTASRYLWHQRPKPETAECIDDNAWLVIVCLLVLGQHREGSNVCSIQI